MNLESFGGIWNTLASYYVGFLSNNAAELIEALTDFHCACVDPKAVRVSASFFGLIAVEEAFQQCPHVRHHLVLAQYCTDKLKDIGSCEAPVSQFLENAQIINFAKKPDQVLQLEKTIKDLKDKYVPILTKDLGSRVACLEVSVYVDLIVRGLFSKPWPENIEPKVTLPTGKMDDAKTKALGRHWAKVVEHKHPAIGFAAAAGLEDPVGPEPTTEALDLNTVRGLSRNPSAPQDGEPVFKRGDSATVIRRMSWVVPTSSDPNFRKDLTVGTEGTIEGFVDKDMRQVLFKVELVVDKKKKFVTQACFPRNLKPTAEYTLWKGAKDLAAKGDPETAEPEVPVDASGKEKVVGKVSEWALKDSEPQNVKIEQKFKDLLADNEKSAKDVFMRSRVFVIMEALLETLPTYKDADFHIVNRRHEKGTWITEIYTKRDFEALEILLAPFSSQLKNTHLTHGANAVVALPKHGRGSHHDNGTLALDGRGNKTIAHKGVLDDEDHTGSLYWIVTRTDEKKSCNMSYKSVSWEQQIKIDMPAPGNKKRKVSVDWATSELPMIPILVNLQKIPKQTQLCVFQQSS